MAVSPRFKAFALDLLGQVVPITCRPMFGGLTFFHEGRAFALADDDRLYLKVDDHNRGAFQAAGSQPFLPFGDPEHPMTYREVPAEALEDPEALVPWVQGALAAAARSPVRRRKQS